MKHLMVYALVFTMNACGSDARVWKDEGDVMAEVVGEEDGGEYIPVTDSGEDTREVVDETIEHACDDGNPCTTDAFYGGECHFDAVTWPLECGNAGRCWVGVCCDNGRCWDMSASSCVAACPDGKVCGGLGTCTASP